MNKNSYPLEKCRFNKICCSGKRKLNFLYRTGHVTEKSKDLTALLVETTRELVNAFSLMTDIKKNQLEMTNSVYKIANYEEKGNKIYREDINLLFDDTAVAVKT